MDPVAGGRFEVGHAFHVGAHLQVYRPILKARWECIAKGDKILRSFGSIDVCQGSRLLARLRHAKPRNECRLKSVKQTSPGGEQVARENYSYSSVGRPSGAASS